MQDEDPFEVSREFSAQVQNASVRQSDLLPPRSLPPADINQPRDIVSVLAKNAVTTQDVSDIDNAAFYFADALSQVCNVDSRFFEVVLAAQYLT